jgi:uncharacterized protein YdgA (DUF945 family)
MKKTAVVAAIVLLGAAGWAGTAWYTGQRVEEAVRRQVEQLNAQPTFGTVQISGYERGVFSSTIHYTVTAENLPLPTGLVGQGDQIAFVSRVAHGPFPWSRLTEGQFGPVLATTHSTLQRTEPVNAWFAAAGEAQPVEERSSIHYDGHIDFQLRFAPLAVKEPDLELESSEAVIAGRTDGNLDVLQFTGTLDAVRIRSSLSDDAKKEPDRLAMQDIAFEADYRLGEFGVYLGDGKASIKRLSLDALDEEGQPLNIALNDYAITSHLSEDASHVSGHLEYALGSVQIGTIDLGSLQALLRFGHLEGQAVKAIMARYREIRPQLMAEVAAHQPESDEMPVLLDEFLDESLERLLPGQPTFGLDPLRWSLGGSESSMRLNVALQHVDGTDDLARAIRSLDAAVVVSQPMVVELLTRLAQVPGAGEPPTPEAAASAARLSFGLFKQMALSTGYVVNENDSLATRLSYSEGQVRINGRQMPLEDLLRDLPIGP